MSPTPPKHRAPKGTKICPCSNCRHLKGLAAFQKMRTVQNHMKEERKRLLGSRRETTEQEMPPSPSTLVDTVEIEFNDEDDVISVANMLPAFEVEFENDHADLLDENHGISNMEVDEEPVAAPSIEQPFLFMAVFLILFRVYFHMTDKATSILIRFFNMVLIAFDRIYRFPTTPDTIKNHLNFDSLTNNLTYYAVYPKCHALFNHESPIPSYCTTEQFPYHPLQSKRACCNTDFTVSIPREFVYNSLKASLERIVKRPGYMDLAESWRNRDVPSDMLFDIYDGNVWNEFTKLDTFSPNEHLVLFTLNIDWFEPFHNANYSCGAIYLTINNLPRSERFK
ncbi:hypothetical protein INT45_008915 [Circinella minor]|uniref:Uncharacterized protein n=1 Tax=Circinella minor TaxID=1195481 RepID=A0A8H7VD84_9FUNG|nr:hypothetical protein INT45_008915 [Circinella minor]